MHVTAQLECGHYGSHGSVHVCLEASARATATQAAVHGMCVVARAHLARKPAPRHRPAIAKASP
eukprot:CAMPEP_0171250586 /NCGR_PEP_ID=MMETSP0790-20130122/50181_1 /TAXON_ID=2925 /ORGANISM="Alexandrium catenella, Strain OF101" /LENGTH=63 /DNA_ID=CAMNT_0011718219 /DNA_START=22 /DNA_END=210 /DNA_ORIENTATION=+